jgi:hypothetical protein
MVDAMFLGLSFSKRNFRPLRAALAAPGRPSSQQTKESKDLSK